MTRISFVELPVRTNIAETRQFYEESFGWELIQFGPTYACTMSGDVDLGLQADASEATKAPLAVIQVDNLEAAVSAVKRNGGTITQDIFPFPGGRRFHFRDPAGNELAAFETNRES